MNDIETPTRDRSNQLLLIMTFMLLGASLIYGNRFANPSNFKALLIGFVSIGFISLGMMMLLISGVFDLSVGSIFGLGMVVVAYFMADLNWPWPLAVAASLAVCACCGAMNGFLVTRMKINPLIATLGTMGILRGAAVMLGGVGKAGFPESFVALGTEPILGLTAPIWLFLIVVSLFIFMFRYLKFFRKFYFVGGNKDAARLCGINVDRVWFSGFVIMSLLAGFAGILYCARLGASTGQAGEGMELRAIAGVVVGGASIKGGKGTILGGVLGALFMALVFNIIGLSENISAYWQPIVNGAILVFAVYTDVIAEQGYFGKILGKARRQS